MNSIESNVPVSYRRARFGRAGRPGRMFAAFVDVEKVHWDINYWTDKEVLAWRDSYVSGCSAIAVAVSIAIILHAPHLTRFKAAIFASIGLSSLSLPNMYETHWSARALLVSSMALGILSVVSATTHQQAVGILNDPVSIRLWLSRGKTSFFRDVDKSPFKSLPLDCSVPKLKSIGLPQLSLNISVILYFVGFGLYFLFLWVQKANGDVLGNRNIFIVFVALSTVSFAYATGLWVAQLSDEKRTMKENNLDGEESVAKWKAYQQLENSLQGLQQQKRGLDIRNEPEYKAFVRYLAGMLDEWAEKSPSTQPTPEPATNETSTSNSALL